MIMQYDSIWRENTVCWDIFPRRLSVPRSEQFSESRARKNCELRGADNVQGQFKYPSIVSPQMEAIVFIILQISFASRVVLKIGDQSRASEKV